MRTASTNLSQHEVPSVGTRSYSAPGTSEKVRGKDEKVGFVLFVPIVLGCFMVSQQESFQQENPCGLSRAAAGESQSATRSPL